MSTNDISFSDSRIAKGTAKCRVPLGVDTQRIDRLPVEFGREAYLVGRGVNAVVVDIEHDGPDVSAITWPISIFTRRYRNTVESLRGEIARLRGKIAALAGEGLPVWEATTGDIRDLPPGGATLSVEFAVEDQSYEDWYPNTRAAKAALFELARQHGRVPTTDGLNVDLTEPGCKPSRAYVTRLENSAVDDGGSRGGVRTRQ